MSDIDTKFGFDHQPRTRIIFGNNTITRLGEVTQELGGCRVLLVTDQGIVKAGHVDSARRNLEPANVKVVVFDRVRENPTTEDVGCCLELATSAKIDLIVGLGGGSSLDTAKGCNFLLTNGGRMDDYRGSGKAKRSMLPMIAIPTTAGTGSETQSFALIANAESHQKMACGDPKAAPKVAILDPLLTLSQPRRVSIATGIDAIAHAVESAVSKRRNPISAMFAKEAFRLTESSIDAVIKDPNNLTARGWMLLGASYAGLAIENSMLGAAHAAANPLTAHYGLVHGIAVGLVLPWVVQFNRTDKRASDIYGELAVNSGAVERQESTDLAVDTLTDRLNEILELAADEIVLSELGVNDEDIPMLANEAAAQWTANFNPRPIQTVDFERIYRNTLLR